MSGECQKCHEHCLDCVCDKLCDNHITDHKHKCDYKQEWLDFSNEIRDQVIRGLAQEPKHRLGPFSQCEWVSVKDRSPDNDIDVLFTEGEDVYIGKRCWYDPGYRWYPDGYLPYLDDEITHWMPLPSPPES